MKKMALLGILALAGCSSAPPLFTKDGRATIQVQCPGGDAGWAECDRRAQVACGSGGYDVLNRTDSSQRSMYIACRKQAESF